MRRTIAALVAVSLLAACSGGNGLDKVADQPVGTNAFGNVDPVPAPPVASPAKVDTSDLVGAAAAVSASFADTAVRMHAVMTALALSGVPVLDPNGNPVAGTGSDQIGLPWAHVSTVAAANTTFALPLSDVVRVWDQGLADPRPEAGPAAQETLAGLRAGLTSTVPEVQFFSALLAATSTRLGGGDLADPATTPDQVLLDAPTIEVYAGRVWRSLALDLAAKGDLADGAAGFTSPRGVAAPSIDCSSDGMDGWGLWVLSKVAGGVDLAKLGLGTFDGILVETMKRARAAKEVSGQVVKASKSLMKFANYFSSSMTVLNLVYELMSVKAKATMSPEPLERNKKKGDGDGKKATITITISVDPPADSEAIQAINCLAALASGVGNNTTFPPPGPIEGVQVEITGKKGFSSSLVTAGTLVLFGPEEVQLKQDTGADGTVKIGVQGRQQPRDYPDQAKPVDKQFSINVSATPEPSGASSAGKTFVDSLLCVAAPGFGCADAVADVVKSFHWDLGEFSFKLIDWQSTYQLSGTEEGVSFTGLVCDLSEPFTAAGSGQGVSVTLTFTPSSTTAGSWSYTGSGGGIPLSGSGQYSIELDDSGGTIDMNGSGQAGGASAAWVNPLTLTATDAEC